MKNMKNKELFACDICKYRFSNGSGCFRYNLSWRELNSHLVHFDRQTEKMAAAKGMGITGNAKLGASNPCPWSPKLGVLR